MTQKHGSDENPATDTPIGQKGLFTLASQPPPNERKTMSAKKHITRLGAALGLAAALSVGLTGIANAANQDGIRNTGELIYYYNSGLAGAWSDFAIAVPNLAGYSYIGGGSSANGFGYAVKNDAASIQNKHATKTVRVYYNSNYAGTWNSCVAGCQGNLTPELKNNNASHKWI